nr:PREDICTED: syntaxin-binding protein 6 [Pelecanus crispus]
MGEWDDRNFMTFNEDKRGQHRGWNNPLLGLGPGWLSREQPCGKDQLARGRWTTLAAVKMNCMLYGFFFFSFICSVTNKKPAQASITKVKQFEGSTSFVRRTQWMLEQLRQVNGIDPNRDSPEFDLLFENAFDQWVASTASEKCTFFQVLHHTCQRYLTDKKPEFINCQSKIMGGNSILHSAADSVTSAVQKASQALNERGERLGRAEEKTEELKNSAQQFAETAHKLAMKHKC